MIKISEIYIYPVKSLAGIKFQTAQLSKFGLQHDRRWMIVDCNGKFISQREMAKMATIKTAINNGQLFLSYDDKEHKVPLTNTQSKQLTVTVWKDTFKASHICSDVDQWLSVILDKSCRLVYMHEQVRRQIDSNYATTNQFVSFADAFPLLVISQASLDDLNKRLEVPVNINRFRPNIVVSGTSAFAEDQWQNLSINEIEYKAVKKCSRCIIPSINQHTGLQDQVKMLAILNSYRKEDKKIKFGQNLIYKNADIIENQTISSGDEMNKTLQTSSGIYGTNPASSSDYCSYAKAKEREVYFNDFTKNGFKRGRERLLN